MACDIVIGRVLIEKHNDCALKRWAVEAIAEIERLTAEVHDCPKCGRACKQCECTEKEIADLKAELAAMRADR